MIKNQQPRRINAQTRKGMENFFFRYTEKTRQEARNYVRGLLVLNKHISGKKRTTKIGMGVQFVDRFIAVDIVGKNIAIKHTTLS